MSDLTDVVGGANLFGGERYSFVEDRFGHPNSAIYFNNGYIKIPEGVYFSGDFSVTFWMNFKTNKIRRHLFNFGNGPESDNVLSVLDDLEIELHIYPYAKAFVVGKSKIIEVNKWYHLAFVMEKDVGIIYVNGNHYKSAQTNTPRDVLRKQNFFGHEYWGRTNEILDEFKIYRGALSSSDVMNTYQNGNNFICFFVEFFKYLLLKLI